MTTDKLDQRVRERAYHIWLEEGEPEGREREHWEKARAEFEEARKEAGTAPKKGKAAPAKRGAVPKKPAAMGKKVETGAASEAKKPPAGTSRRKTRS